ncbi:MAG: Nramp family divalent metal transporter [Puniceicoccales bacterium]|jgi:manganese transport protein|nr:Nramp family divalent metal transporter [Puniceicoccales bacterium]
MSDDLNDSAAGGAASSSGAVKETLSTAGAWRRLPAAPSLAEAHRSIKVDDFAGTRFFGALLRRFPRLRKFFAFAGPGFLVAVGYMDPGNWATDLEGGSRFGYTLLAVILVSNLMAILLQHLCVKLGVVTGRDLAQACRDHYPRPVAWFQWVLCEIAIAACDLAEVIGTAIGLQLLFGIPLLWGCAITALDVFAVLWLQNRGFRLVEAVVITLMLTVGGCFAAELFMAKPSIAGVLAGLVPSAEIARDPQMLYVAIGILGATVMPHNLYLHSSIVQTRDFPRTAAGKREAVRFATLDSSVALLFAFFINAAILILAAAAFHGKQEVAEIQDGYKLLGATLGPLAATLFAVALLASGQNSTITGTLAGQIVMEGFINLRVRPWLRRLITRGIALVPAVLVIALLGESWATRLLVLSQVILSFQLGFAVWPLLRFTGERAKMGEFTNPLWIKICGWTCAFVIIGLNLKLLYDTAVGWNG